MTDPPRAPADDASSVLFGSAGTADLILREAWKKRDDVKTSFAKRESQMRVCLRAGLGRVFLSKNAVKRPIFPRFGKDTVDGLAPWERYGMIAFLE
jgi:hypothetical protein